jgi:Ca2+-binding RTX toxin-like protein
MYSTFVRPTEEQPEKDDGNDSYNGGGGIDLLSYQNSVEAVDVSLAEGRATGNGQDEITEVENLITTEHAERIEGDSRNNLLSGGAGDDVIKGLDGDDRLIGGRDNDSLEGGTGVDTADFASSSKRLVVNLAGRAATGEGEDTLLDIEDVYGGRRNDIIIGDNAANRLHGGASGKDTLRGLDGDDRLIGGLDDVTKDGLPINVEEDVLIGGPGDDRLDGVFGVDTADYASAAAGVTADLVSGTATGEGTDILVSIEDLAGSGYDDVLSGDAVANELTGRAGNDVLQGREGDDFLIGGTGDDTYDGGDGADALDFGRSRTAITADLGVGTITGEGSDTVTGVENVFGSTRADTLIGDDSPNYINGRTNDDNLQGMGGEDILIGLKGGDTIDGGDGNDMLFDGDEADNVTGGAGEDYFRTGIGDDFFDGGDGMDTLDFGDSERGITADLIAGTTSTFGDQGSDSMSDIENLLGTTQTDEFQGGLENNYFVSHGGVDELYGGEGDDLLESLGGADISDGEEGEDTVVYGAAPRPITADLAAGFASGHGADTILSLEHLIGSVWPDIVRGTDTTNIFFGGVGGDIIEGLAGDDHLDGGDGFDTLDGGEGTDECANGESALECEGSTASQAAADEIMARYTQFQALQAHWAAERLRMESMPK